MKKSTIAFVLVASIVINAQSFAAISSNSQSAAGAQKQINATYKAKLNTQATPKQSLVNHYQRVSEKVEFARQRVNHSTQLNGSQTEKILANLLVREDWLKTVETQIQDLSTNPKRTKAQAGLVAIRNQLESTNVVNKRYPRTRLTGTMAEEPMRAYAHNLMADISAEISTMTNRYDKLLASKDSVQEANKNLGKTRTKQQNAKQQVDKVKNTSVNKSEEVQDAQKALKSTENSLNKTNKNLNSTR